MRKFIVLHSASEWDLHKPVIVYIDAISHILPLVTEENDNKTESGTMIYVYNWCINVQESMGDVLRKIKEQEQA